MGNLTELDDTSFKNFIKENNKAVVDFWATWCAPCVKMEPAYEELDKEMKDVAFAKVNVDDAPLLSAGYEIRVIPTLLFFKKGVKVGEITGLRPKEKLREKINEYLAL